MKTIAKQINWNFETHSDLIIKNKENRLVYYEKSNGYWSKREYDSQGKEIYYETSDGYWVKYEYDSQGKEIYWESSNGVIKDKRPKTCENKEIEIEGVKYKLVKA